MSAVLQVPWRTLRRQALSPISTKQESQTAIENTPKYAQPPQPQV